MWPGQRDRTNLMKVNRCTHANHQRCFRTWFSGKIVRVWLMTGLGLTDFFQAKQCYDSVTLRSETGLIKNPANPDVRHKVIHKAAAIWRQQCLTGHPLKNAISTRALSRLPVRWPHSAASLLATVAGPPRAGLPTGAGLGAGPPEACWTLGMCSTPRSCPGQTRWWRRREPRTGNEQWAAPGTRSASARNLRAETARGFRAAPGPARPRRVLWLSPWLR